ncbi:MAG: NAD(P)H-dependent oxidoreductase [Bdellovibrionales bacterium]|nr:NAD(P)H-dependent oxidoreductase [Bdellovibrionales bacterium]
MAKLIIYYAHPGEKFSRVNKKLAEIARSRSDLTFVDLYQEYPRYDIDVDREQERLINHDVILFQHPLFWYSTPAIIKEWIDLVLEHGFAFGTGGDNLQGKIMMNATSAAGPVDAYTPKGYQHYPLRTFLTPLEQTARLCHMKYSAPYVLYSALKADEDTEILEHASGYEKMLQAIVDGSFDFESAINEDVITSKSIQSYIGANND